MPRARRIEVWANDVLLFPQMSQSTDVVLDPRALDRRIRALCQVGPRFLGTSGERAAGTLIADWMKAAGLADVRAEPVPALGYRPRHASCVVHPADTELPAAGLQFSASGTASGPGVYVGELRSVEEAHALESRAFALEGAIVVFHSTYPYLPIPYLVERGVAGVIVISEAPGDFLSHYTAQLYPPASSPAFAGRPISIPGVIVSDAWARTLIFELGIGGTEISIDHAADYEPVESANIVGMLRGREPASSVVVGAHYDTQLDSPGACDNASGVAALLEIAATFAAQVEPLRSIIFVAFADEEHGCVGSTTFCRVHKQELGSIVAMVNLDALGWALPGRRALYADPAIRDLAFRVASSCGWTPEEELEAGLFPGSDYNPFIDAGVPAAFYWQYPPNHPYYHSLGDRPELMNVSAVAETATVAASLVDRLARDEALALGRSRPSHRWIDLRPEGTQGASSP
jgi:hypothetical protein